MDKTHENAPFRPTQKGPLCQLKAATSCHAQENQGLKNRKLAQALNDTAVSLFQKYGYQKDSLKKAVQFLDNAIKKDSTYTISYSNRVSILCGLGDCRGALETIEKLVRLRKADPVAITLEGHILEKTGDTFEAIQKYKTADSIYDSQIESKINIVQNKIDKSYLQLFLKSKDDAVAAFDRIKKEIPAKDAKQMTETINDFDKDKFFNDFCRCNP
ncbi:hypothetical protein JN11_04348 [Mucilaginibacter frigoritolerans]|uniref:Uncharacterized protein n=1 Tax=Mucilaginibacter frigoritolerans TaxID=652788 RepID=A0A562TPV7_9SPHI|nr:hypothetical protein [Mucilaginibacter frigoritolerans]TWI95609.1 hypothetical protein JN11_04348 [Mucilaginibacter frigoritolerans]